MIGKRMHCSERHYFGMSDSRSRQPLLIFGELEFSRRDHALQFSETRGFLNDHVASHDDSTSQLMISLLQKTSLQTSFE
ncbi:hypothetical protein [Agrobacterium sp. NPDC090283]|uniref:hypothetical protein n=1 Tax=Agrobacterium sp. NPDC090283 TaxID=3363920 RepID=UPI00383AD44A